MLMKTLAFCLTALMYLNLHSSNTTELRNFLENNVSWMKDCQDNRIYIKNECLIVAEDGIYVGDESNKIPLTELFADSQGIYTRIESLGTEIATVWNIVWCQTCMAYRSTDIRGNCVKCGNRP